MAQNATFVQRERGESFRQKGERVSDTSLSPFGVCAPKPGGMCFVLKKQRGKKAPKTGRIHKKQTENC